MKKYLFLIFVFTLLIFSGCDGGSSDESDSNGGNITDPVYYYVTFKLDGVQQTYETRSGFGFIKLDAPFNYWSCKWTIDWFSSIPVAQIRLPLDVTVGSTYDHLHPDFEFLWGDDYNYLDSMADDFTLTITQWDGPDGLAKGTFSGKVTSVVGNITKVITEGSFEATIDIY